MTAGESSGPGGSPVAVWVELDLDSQPIKGTLSPPTGPPIPFVGWLGLTAALGRLHDRRQTPGDTR